MSLTEKDIQKVIPVLTAEAKNILETNKKNFSKSKDNDILKQIKDEKTDPLEYLQKKTSFVIVPVGYVYNKELSVLVSIEMNSPTVVYTVKETNIFTDKPEDSVDLKTIGTLKELENNEDYKAKLSEYEADKNNLLRSNFIPLDRFISPDNKVSAGVIDNSVNLFNFGNNGYNNRMIIFTDNEYNEKTKGVSPLSSDVQKMILKNKLTYDKYDVIKRTLMIARNDSRDLTMLDLPNGGGDDEFQKMLEKRKLNAKLYIKYSNVLDSIFEIILSNNF